MDVEGKYLNPHYALGFVTACPDLGREGLKTQENEALWRVRRSHPYGELEKGNEAANFVRRGGKSAVEILMHIREGINSPLYA